MSRAFKRICFFFVFVSVLALPSLAEAASRYWVADVAGNWNDIANWSTSSDGAGGSSIPGVFDIAYFDGNGLGDCSLNEAVNIAGMNIASGYAGTITQQAGITVTVGASSYTQAGGTFTAAASSFDVTGSIVVSGGTLNLSAATSSTVTGDITISGSGTLTMPAETLTLSGSWHHNAGTFNHNNGTLQMVCGGRYINTADSNQIFYNLHLEANNCNGYYNFNPNKNFAVANTLTLKRGFLDAAKTITASNNLVVESTWNSQGYTDLLVVNLTGSTTTTINGSYAPGIHLNSATATLNFTGTTNHKSTTTLTAGTLNWSGAHTFVNLTNAGLTTVYPDTSLTVSGTMTVSSGSFTLGSGSSSVGTLTVSGGSLVAGTGSVAVTGSIANSAGALNLSSAASATVTGDITISGTGTLTMPAETLSLKGHWYHNAGTFNHNNGTLQMLCGGRYVNFPNANQSFYNLYLDGNSAYELGCNLYSNFNPNNNFTVANTLTLNRGMFHTAFTISTQGDLVLGANFAGTSGSAAAISLTGSNAQTITINSGGLFPGGTFTINKTNATDTVTVSGAAFTLNTAGQDLTLTKGVLNLNGQNLTVNDQFTIADNAGLTLQGGETISGGPDTITAGSTITYNGSGASYTMKDWTYSNVTIAGGASSVFTLPGTKTVNNLTITSGIFSTGGYDLTVSGTLSNDGTFRLEGDETLSLTFDTNSGTTEYVGTSSYASLPFSSYYHLVFNAAGTWTMAANATVAGNLTISSGTLEGATYTLSVAGNWSNSGTFTYNTSTVNLNGTDQSIGGSSANTFYNLTKVVTVARTLTFPVSTTTTITNRFRAYGTSGQLLSLRSSQDTVQALVNINQESFLYLDIQDVKNANASVALCSLGCVDSGNTENGGVETFDFTSVSSQTQTWNFADASPANAFDYDNSVVEINAASNGLARLIDLGGGTYTATSGLPGFNLYREVPITNGGGSGLTEIQVKVSVTYDSDMQADFDDIRFLDSDNSTALSYWLESKIDSTSADFWVKVPSLPAAGKTLYMYYGNGSAASGSSVSDTFIFGDDFDSASLAAGWTAQISTAGSPATTPSGGTWTKTCTAASGNCDWWGSNALDSGLYINKPAGSWEAIASITAETNAASAHTGIMIAADVTGGDGYMWGRYSGSNYQVERAGWGGQCNSGAVASAPSLLKIINNAGTYSFYRSTDSGANWSQCGTFSIAATMNMVGLFQKSWGAPTASTTYDYFVIKKYVATQPTAAVSGSENAVSENLFFSNSGTGTHPTFTGLYSFVETLGAGNTGSVYYQISNNGTDWYYHNGSSWTAVVSTDDYNIAAEVSAFISDFTTDVGTGNFYFKAFLVSNGSQPVEIDNISLVYGLPTATISVASVAVTEGGATSTYTVALSAQPSSDVTVTPTSGDLSYGVTVSPSSLTFTNGNWASAQTITVTSINDTRYEGAHNTSITHASTSGDSLFNAMTIASVTANITDNDAQPSISIAAGSNTEASAVVLVATLSHESAQGITVNYASSNGTALAGTDYTAVSSSLSFSAGETSKNISVTTLTDTLDEDNETFTVTLSGPTNATLGTASASGTINDDDNAPSLSINDVSNAESANAQFTVTLSAASGKTVTVDYASSDATATAASDYTAASGTLTFSAGETTKTVTITVTGDNVVEDNETLTLTLSNPNSNATISDATGTATLTNDDTAGVTIVESAASTAVTEGGGTDTYTVVLTSEPTASVTVTPLSSDTTNGATFSPATLTFTTANWSTPQTITVTAVNDTRYEPAHANVSITHSASGGGYDAVVISSVTVGVTDNDSQPALSVNDPSVNEGNSGTTTLSYTVTLSNTSDQSITVDYASSDATATAGSDYTAASGALTFSAGETTKSIDVTVNGDAVDEDNETLSMTLSNAGNATISDASGVGTITDDDGVGVTITLSGGNTQVTEGGATDNYSVVLNSEPTALVKITLTPDAQLTLSSTSLEFDGTNWNVPQTVTVTAMNDLVDEASLQSVVVTHAINTADTLDAGYDTVVGISDVSVDVTDNDTAAISLTESGGATLVSEDGTVDSYTVVLATKPTSNVTVTLTANAQVSSSPSSLTFTSGNWNTVQTVTVTAVNDSVDEENPHTGLITHTSSSSDSYYQALSIANIQPSISDNDSAGITLSETEGDTLLTAESDDIVQIKLSSKPTADVVVTVVAPSGVTATPSSLTFTASNWETNQEVTLSLGDTELSEAQDGTLSVSAASSDSFYQGKTGTLSFSMEATVTEAALELGEDVSVNLGYSVTLTPQSATGAAPLSYAWSVVSGSATLSSTSAASIAVTPTAAGTVVVQLVLSDAQETSATDTVTIRVWDAQNIEEEEEEEKVVFVISGGVGVSERQVPVTGGTATALVVGNSEVILPEEANSRYIFKIMADGRVLIGVPDELSGAGRVYVSTVPYQELAEEVNLRELSLGAGSSLSLSRQADLNPEFDLSDNTQFSYASGNQSEGAFGSYIEVVDTNEDGEEEIVISAPNAGLYGLAYVYNSDMVILGTIYGKESQGIASMFSVNFFSGSGPRLLVGPHNFALNEQLTAYVAPEGASELLLLNDESNFEGELLLSDEPEIFSLLTGEAEASESVQSSTSDLSVVSYATGDLNNDKVQDLAVFTMLGTGYVFYGSESMSSNINLSEADVIISGGTSSAKTGNMIAIEDVTGDGFEDLVIGAPFAGTENQGAIYVVYGGSGFGSVDLSEASAEYLTLSGTVAEGKIGGDLLLALDSAFSESQSVIYTLRGTDTVISFRLNAENSVAEEEGGNGNTDTTSELKGGGGGGCSLAQDTPLKSNALLLWMGFVFALMSLRYKIKKETHWG